MTYQFPLVPIITDAEEAKECAIEWQHWVSGRSMSIGELAKWQSYFEDLAEKYDLTDEFIENAII